MTTRPENIARLARCPLFSFAALAAVGGLFLASAGCGSTDKPAAKTADTTDTAKLATTTAPSGAAPKPDTKSATSGSVHIDDKIIKACGDLPAAHFAFDSAAIGAEAQGALDALARCFVSGPLKSSKGMRLVGHADPRGETEYNIGLGQKRAGSVAEYLSTKGVEKARVQTLSKGALEATGTDEEGWARDRKVEVLLAE